MAKVGVHLLGPAASPSETASQITSSRPVLMRLRRRFPCTSGSKLQFSAPLQNLNYISHRGLGV